MKKSNLMLITVIALMSFISVSSRAQFALNNLKALSAGQDGIFSNPESGTGRSVNLKAEKNFRKDYRHTNGAEWSILSDSSLVCRFFMNNILYRAFYNAYGRWMGSISSYDANKLEKVVYDKIKSTYYDSRIVFVNQIDRVNEKTVYIVEIQDEKSIKKLRVGDDEMEIIQEFEKQ
jgi:hypothetical protein